MNTPPFEELLSAVRADPASDAPRLTLSDAYEAMGDEERARFVRLQNRRANLPWWHRETTDLELEERAILERREREWRAELPSIEGVRWGRFERGLVSTVALEHPGLLQGVGAVCFAASAIRRVVFSWPRGADRPELTPVQGVRELTVVGTVMDARAIEWLAKSPFLSTLGALNLVDSELHNGFPRLLRSKQLRHLEALRVPLHRLGTRGVKQLVSAALENLVELDLSAATIEDWGSGRRYQPAIDDKGAYLLSVWSGLSRLQSLNLNGNSLGVDGLRTLLGSPYTESLRRLGVRDIADGEWEVDDSLEAFQTGPMGSLEELDIGDNDLNALAAQALAEAPALSELKVLRADRVQSKDFATLFQSPWVDSLRVVRCSASALPALLARAPKHLHTLEIEADASSPTQVVDAFTNALLLPSLRVLNLDDAGIDDEGLRRLASVSCLPNLSIVTIWSEDPEFGEEAASQFAGSALGRQLASLELGLSEFDRLPRPVSVVVGHGRYAGPLKRL